MLELMHEIYKRCRLCYYKAADRRLSSLPIVSNSHRKEGCAAFFFPVAPNIGDAMNKHDEYGYTPYWNLSVSELLNIQRTNAAPDKELETELARRLSRLFEESKLCDVCGEDI